MANSQAFLNAIACRLLEGPTPAAHGPAAGRPPRAAVPLAAREFLQRLAQGIFDKPELVAGNLESLTHRPARVTPGRRAASLAIVPTAIALISVLMSVAIHLDDWRKHRAWAAAFPDRPHLAAAARLYLTTLSAVDEGLQPAERAEALRAYLVTRYSDVITNEAFWANPNLSADITTGERALLVQAVVGHIAPSETALLEAERSMDAAVRQIEAEDRLELWFVTVVITFVLLTLCGAIGFLAACRGSPGLGFRLVGLTLVDHEGLPAGRWRVLARWCIVSGFLILLGLLGAGLPFLQDLAGGLAFPVLGEVHPQTSPWTLGGIVLLTLVLAAAVIRAVMQPDCSWVDRLAGTRIVLE